MSSINIDRSGQLRSLIEAFLTERLNSKLEKLPLDDPKRAELLGQFTLHAWLEDAAHRVAQIQAVTHSIKPLHPYAKGSSLYCQPRQLTQRAEVGSHCLGEQFDADVVGNAAALDVYKFLKLKHEGQTLLALANKNDPDLAQAMSADPALAKVWMTAFSGLATPRGELSSHTQAKQLYWLMDGDAHDDQSYHLLAPLYPTSLVHRVYKQLQNDRFSDEAKQARAARKEGAHHARVIHEYPNLAIQKLGGTNQQNISQLNSERHGDNCLLASLPPIWKAPTMRPLLRADSLFNVFAYRKLVRAEVRDLLQFLKTEPPKKRETRERVDRCLAQLLDELLTFQAEYWSLDAGWSLDSECRLPTAHQVWLDPACERPSDVEPMDDDEAALQVADGFALWINDQLRDPMPVGNDEFLHWHKLARQAFAAYEREAA